MRLTWLPDVLRAAGLAVDTYPGWETRGSEVWGMDNTNPSYRFPLQGVICHATASSQSSTDAGDMRVLWVTGSVTAPAPISQLFLSRSGRWVVGATGRCNHVLVGDKGPHEGFGNYQLIGVEAQNDNRGEPWSAHMLDSYERGVAAICGHEAWPASVAVAHREHQTGKSDPLGIDMAQFRAAVNAILTGTQTPPPARGDDMLIFAIDKATKQVYRCNGVICVPVPDDEVLNQTYVYGGGAEWTAVSSKANAVGPWFATAVPVDGANPGVLSHLAVYGMGFFGEPVEPGSGNAPVSLEITLTGTAVPA